MATIALVGAVFSGKTGEALRTAHDEQINSAVENKRLMLLASFVRQRNDHDAIFRSEIFFYSLSNAVLGDASIAR